MARSPKTATIEKSQTTALTNWEEELAKEAQVAAAMEANAGGGAFFSTKSGVLSFADMPMPNNQIAAVVVDSIFENVFYEGRFDPDNPTPPTCFAFGRDEAELKPHPTVIEHGQAQHEQCRGCPRNEWNTADTGRGKACRNTRRLALIPAGELDAAGRFTPYDVEQLAEAAGGMLKLPVTSVKGWATYVKTIAGALNRPPLGVFTKIRVVPDAKTQFRVVFEPLGPVPNEAVPTLMERRRQFANLIDQPYNLDVEERAPTPSPRGGRGGTVARPQARGRKY